MEAAHNGFEDSGLSSIKLRELLFSLSGSDIHTLFLTVSVVLVLEGHFHCLYKNKIMSFLNAFALIRVPGGGPPQVFLAGPLLSKTI